jgi:YHS domain-containing protein
MRSEPSFLPLRAVVAVVAGLIVSGSVQPAPAHADAPSPHAPASSTVSWHRDIATAKAAAAASGRQMLVIFTASWNEPSSRFEAALTRSLEATTLLSACFEPIRINVSDDPWTTRRMGVSNVPAACIIDEQEKVLVRFDCPAAAENFVAAVCKASREAAVASLARIEPSPGDLPATFGGTTTPPTETGVIEPPVVAATTEPTDVMPVEQLGLEGYCPVSVVTQESWVPGDPEITFSHRGRTYRFAGEAEKRAFEANPDWYAPAFSGDDAVLASRQGLVVSGKRAYSAAYKSRLYLFNSPDTRSAFVANPETYIRRTQIARGQTPTTRVR